MARNVDFNFDRPAQARDNPRMVGNPDGNFLGGVDKIQPARPAPGLPENYRALGPDLHLDAVRRAGGPRPRFSISEQTRNNEGDKGGM